MIPFPKEHGAYGQLSFPIATALLASGGSSAAGLLALATVAGFLAHEPAAIILGLRGVRAKREDGAKARRWMAGWLAIAIVGGWAALVTMPAHARWSLVFPTLPALVLFMAMVSGREKSWYGEIASALAFSGVAVPMVLSCGGSLQHALAVAVPFALLFVAGTLAIRVVILRVRGGGDIDAATTMSRAAFIFSGSATGLLIWGVVTAALHVSTLVAAAPGLAMAVAVAYRPPAPSQLRTLGWSLVAASVATATITIVAARL